MPLQSLFSISILLVTHRLMVSLHTSTISATLPFVYIWYIFLNVNRLSSACGSFVKACKWCGNSGGHSKDPNFLCEICRSRQEFDISKHSFFFKNVNNFVH